MLKDEQILPLCRMWAHRFLHQAKKIGDTEQSYNELLNIAYCSAKNVERIEAVSAMIMWTLIRFLEVNDKEKDREFRRTDLRENRNEFDPPCVELIVQKDEQDRLVKAINSLTDFDRSLIFMYYGQNMTFITIGEVFNRGRDWARLHHERIINQLREQLKSKKD